MIPPHQTPSTDLLERIRRYIAAHLQGSSDIIEEAKRKLPRPVPRPFEGERERHDLEGRRHAAEESKILSGMSGVGFGLDGILSRLKSKLDKPRETFFERLMRLIDESGMTDVEAYKRAGIDRRRFSKMRSGQLPSARTIFAFIFVPRLNLDDARDLLASAGHSISPASEFDLAMQYCIEEGFDIDTVNEILYGLGMSIL